MTAMSWGDAQAGFEDGVDDADGDRVVVAEDAVGDGVQLQELLHGLVAADPTVGVGGAADDVVALEGGEIVAGQGLVVTFETADGGAGGGAADVGDLGASDGD